MSQKTIEEYKKEILKKFKEEEGGRLAGYETNLTSSSVKKACVYLYNVRKSESDVTILKSFFEIDKYPKLELQEIIKKTDEDRFKPIWKFLKGETQRTSPTRLDLIAWLVDFKPRPSQLYRSDNIIDEKVHENKNYRKENIEQIETVKTKSKLFFKVSTAIIIVILLLLLAIAFGIGKSTHLMSKDINALRQISVREIPSYMETHTTLWKGVSLNGETEYYNNSGEHPETGIKLVLVKNEELKEITKKPELLKPEAEDLVKEEPKKTKKKMTSENRMKVFVLGKDKQLNNKIKVQLQSKVFQKFTMLGSLSLTSVDQKVLETNLSSGNIAILGKNLGDKTDYVCVGVFEHSFRSSTINAQINICDLEVSYTVYDNKGNIKSNLSKSDTFIGQGFTKQEALKNAIKQIE